MQGAAKPRRSVSFTDTVRDAGEIRGPKRLRRHTQIQSASYTPGLTHLSKLECGHSCGQRARPCLTGL